MFTRRSLMQFVGVATSGYIGNIHSTELKKGKYPNYPFDPRLERNFIQKLFIPMFSGLLGVLDVVGPLKIRATASSFAILPGPDSQGASPFLLYQTEYAGSAFENPIFRIERGARFTASLKNDMPEPTIIHWHGLHTPAAMDGHPSSTIGPGASYHYDFNIVNRGGTYWYHTHAHELTAKQAYNGLASFFLVEDDDQRALTKAVNLQLGETDLPLVIQDKQFDATGALHYKPNAHESMMGWLGDVVVVNLTPNAVQSVARRTYRFRLLNGSNARIYRLAFVLDGSKLNFSVVGTDGGLIERAESVTEAFIAPGERLDVLFDAGQAEPGKAIFLKSLAFDAMENEGDMGGKRNWVGDHDKRETSSMSSMSSMESSSSRLAMGAEFNILKLSVMVGDRTTARLPAILSKIKAIAKDGATKRDIDLSMRDMSFLINGLRYQAKQIAFDVKRATVEIWTIRNPAIGMPHPLHIHGFSFQVVERLNSPPHVSDVGQFGGGRTVSDLGLKDTVLVWPGETVRIAIDFSHDFPGNQTYVFHCHNLEHEDAAMMINFRVVT